MMINIVHIILVQFIHIFHFEYDFNSLWILFDL